MKAIIGLGNPGQKYAKTRHNLGFMVVDELIRRLHPDSPRERFRAQLWETRLDDQRIVLVKPQTYMNLSGISVQQVQNWYKVAGQDMLVIYDDVDLEFGVLRMRERGSAGGHNGLSSIVESLGTTEVPRIRIGVGRGGSETTAHVLSGFSKSESETLGAIIDKAAGGAMLWLRVGPIPAMNMLNQRDKTSEPAEDASVKKLVAGSTVGAANPERRSTE